jgi:hypothetical protein
VPDHRRSCEQCGQRFSHIARLPHPRTCGRILCRALETWGPAEWEGQRRMARARQASGVVCIRYLDDEGRKVLRWEPGDPLNDLDRAALAREA